MNHDSKTGSIPEKDTGFTVAASPLNPVKLELGAILITGVVLLLIVSSLVESNTSQLVILFLYGVSAMIWIVVRVKKIMTEEMQINGSS